MSTGLAADLHASVGDFRLSARLEVGASETVAVVGPNGAGKTTLARVIAGLVRLTDGRVVLGAEVLDDPRGGVWVAPEHRRVGVVFQDNVLFPHLSALDNVAFGLRARGRSLRDARRRAADWLDRFDLTHRASARPDQLSGGQAQRVALARALASEPELVVLDEPFAALDASARREIRREIQSHLSDLEIPRLLITHDPVDAAAVADRLVVLEGGTVVQVGGLDELTARPRSRYVADFVGTNLFRGRGRGSSIEVGTGTLVAAEASDGDVLVVVPPRAVTLATIEPETSARNTWAGVVESVQREGDRARVRVRGSIEIVAEITVASAETLGIATGTAVWVSVKATEISVSPA